MTRKELYESRKAYLMTYHSYKLWHWNQFNYSILNNIMYRKKAGRGDNNTFNECIIMCDTETSKKDASVVGENHIVAWTISIRAFELNICTLYGRKPTTFIQCLNKILEQLQGDETIFYWHNMSYDWVFIRKFMFNEYGHPSKQLNTKSHYPIYIKWDNGITFKDSLILAQRGLEKWASDMHVEHQKSVGKWNYDKIRTQHELFTVDELEYIEHDTLAGVECIEATMKALNKSLYSIPYTATGIPREETRKRGKEYHAHNSFLNMALDLEKYLVAEHVYHGGFTHANRHYINVTIRGDILAYDFASSYPYALLCKAPMEKFTEYHNCELDEILRNRENYAFMFKLILIKPRLKDDFVAMPVLQFSKCVKIINPVLDNGRVLAASYVEIYINEIDASLIKSQYIYDKNICINVTFAAKDYLPRWFTDYVYELFKQKTLLKNGDPVLYSIAKAKLNSLYGMCAQKCIKQNLEENYITGEYKEVFTEPDKLYDKYLKKAGSILPYQWCIWVTSTAMENLFKLGECYDTWLYSDTDSCYGIGVNQGKIDAYNNEVKRFLESRGYSGIDFNGRSYWLGVAELDGQYTEFRMQGAKRYCCRSAKDGKLKITVAGVPKKGVACLDNSIDNFVPGLIFSGAETGKKTHTYFYVDDIYTDENGNITGDSIDLSPCDYLLDDVNTVDWETIFNEEINIQTYDTEDVI